MANDGEHFPYKPRVVLLRPRHNEDAPPWTPSTARFTDETTSAAHYVDNSAHFRAMEVRHRPRQEAAISGAPFDDTTTSRWAYRPFEYIVSERTKSPQKEQVIVM